WSLRLHVSRRTSCCHVLCLQADLRPGKMQPTRGSASSASLRSSTGLMTPDVTASFDLLASLCDVSAPLCEAAGAGLLDVPLDLRAICTRLGLPQARSGDVERALSSGQSAGVFVKTTETTWRVLDKALAVR